MVRSLPRSEQILLSEKIEFLKSDFHNQKLKTHQLTGKLKNIYSFSLTYSKRVLFIMDKDKIIFMTVGSHNQVYR
jgi:mRNA-degrading endonuclease YafQ of YafQ-DinJ toxin-antitoxin module